MVSMCPHLWSLRSLCPCIMCGSGIKPAPFGVFCFHLFFLVLFVSLSPVFSGKSLSHSSNTAVLACQIKKIWIQQTDDTINLEWWYNTTPNCQYNTTWSFNHLAFGCSLLFLTSHRLTSYPAVIWKYCTLHKIWLPSVSVAASKDDLTAPVLRDNDFQLVHLVVNF